MCDAYHRYINVSIGAQGSCSDGGVFKKSSLGESLNSDRFQTMAPSKLPNSHRCLPHFLIGDNAYALKSWMMVPFSDRCKAAKNDEEARKRRIFNYRHSRARRSIESTFGILSSKFRCLRNTLELQPEKVDLIVCACCLLHNIIINLEGTQYTSKDIDDFVEEYRKRRWEEEYTAAEQQQQRNASKEAKKVRIELMEYFCNEGRIYFDGN